MNKTITFRTPQADHFLGLAPYLRMSLLKQDLLPISTEIFSLLKTQPENPELLMNASIVMQIFNRDDLAAEAQNNALAIQRTYQIPAVQQPASVKLLVLSAPGDVAENTPIDCLLEGWDIDLTFYYLDEYAIPWDELPEFDIVLIGACDSVPNQILLQNLSEQLKDCPKPVLNRPQFIKNTERVTASQILQGIEGLVMPPTLEISREDLTQIGLEQKPLNQQFDWARFPLILRPVDSHGGKNLEKIDSSKSIQDYLNRVPDAQFYLSNFIDYADHNSLYTKIRIVLIDGQAYISHLAITTDWKIHYLNAEMDQSEQKRATEQAFMENFESFVKTHQSALNGIYQQAGLDYIGIDCAVTPDGKLLVFEIDHAMIVHGMDDETIFPYKPKFAQKIPAAFREMLLKRKK